MSAPAPVTIDRLSLRAGALSEAEARRLAELVGLALGRLPLRPTPTAAVTVSPPPGATVEQLATAVVRAIEEALRADGARS
jgi:hypothetical protein